MFDAELPTTHVRLPADFFNTLASSWDRRAPPASPYRQRLTELRDYIAGVPDKHFSMAHWYSGPSPANDFTFARCIGGWAEDRFEIADSTLTARYLGLSQSLAHALFCPRGYEDPTRYSKADAIRAIDALIETGSPAWP